MHGVGLVVWLPPKDPDIQVCVCYLQGSSFFDGLLQKLQVSYQFKLEDYMDGMAIRSKPLRKMVGWLLPGDPSCCSSARLGVFPLPRGGQLHSEQMLVCLQGNFLSCWRTC